MVTSRNRSNPVLGNQISWVIGYTGRKDHPMEKISFSKLFGIMSEFNINNPDKQDTACITGVIVFKQSNFKKPFSERDRSYRVSNANRQFQQGKISNQLSGDCLDGKDLGVRLDWYNWEVEYCYMEET